MKSGKFSCTINGNLFQNYLRKEFALFGIFALIKNSKNLIFHKINAAVNAEYGFVDITNLNMHYL